MEIDFQTSFIPKKPMMAPPKPEKGKPVSFVTFISILIFFTILIATGALYFYKGTLSSGITKMQNDLKLAEGRFEPAKLSQLALLDKRLRAGSSVLDKHVAVSPIFQELEKITIKTVRYTSFNYSQESGTSGKIAVKLIGVATDYTSVAVQSDFFSQDKNFIDPVFSNLTLNQKGNVSFDLQFSVDPSFINYKKALAAAAAN